MTEKTVFGLQCLRRHANVSLFIRIAIYTIVLFVGRDLNKESLNVPCLKDDCQAPVFFWKDCYIGPKLLIFSWKSLQNLIEDHWALQSNSGNSAHLLSIAIVTPGCSESERPVRLSGAIELFIGSHERLASCAVVQQDNEVLFEVVQQ